MIIHHQLTPIIPTINWPAWRQCFDFHRFDPAVLSAVTNDKYLTRNLAQKSHFLPVSPAIVHCRFILAGNKKKVFLHFYFRKQWDCIWWGVGSHASTSRAAREKEKLPNSSRFGDEDIWVKSKWNPTSVGRAFFSRFSLYATSRWSSRPFPIRQASSTPLRIRLELLFLLILRSSHIFSPCAVFFTLFFCFISRSDPSHSRWLRPLTYSHTQTISRGVRDTSRRYWKSFISFLRSRSKLYKEKLRFQKK